MMKPGRLVPLLFGALACACGGDAPVATGVRVDTIGGVVHVLNTGAGLWAPDERWRVDTARMVEIGAVEGGDPYVFGRVTAVVTGADGRIYVADAQAAEIRVFSPAGEFLSRLGRDGEGPGEFRDVSGLGIAPDGGIAALDGQLGRVSLFRADGEFVRSFRLERPFMITTYGALVRFDSLGRFYDRTTLSHAVAVDTLAIVRYSPAGEVDDTVIVAIHEPQRVFVRRGGVPVMSLGLPFAAAPLATVGPDGSIYATRADAYEIARLGPGGDTLRVIRRAVTPPVVTAAERDSALREIRQRYREAAGAEPRELPPIPDHKPAILALHVDDAGYLWVLGSPEGPAEAGVDWDVFDLEGRYLGPVPLPPMVVWHIGERAIAGVAYDELGVARVRVVPLDRRPLAR